MTRLFKNIFANEVGLFISILITFFLTPFIVHTLGPVKYGIWALAVSFTGHYGLLTFGIQGALTRYFAEAFAANDNKAATEYISTAFLIMLVAACLALIAGFILAFFSAEVFKIPHNLQHESFAVFLIIAASASLSFLGGCFHASLAGAQRFDILSIINIISTIIRAILIVIILNCGYGLVGLAFLNLGINGFQAIFKYGIFKFHQKDLHIKLGAINRNSVKTLLSYGTKSFISSIAVILVFEIDLFVVGLGLGPAFVTVYSLGASLVNYFMQFVNAIAYTFGPFATERYTTRGLKALSDFFHTASQIMYLIAGLAVGGCMIYGAPFFRLWMGPGYSKSATILSILITAQFFGSGARPAGSVFSATVKVGPQAVASILEGICNLTLSLLFVHYFGLIGVALGTLIPMALNNGIWAPIYACRILKTSIFNYFMYAVAPGVGIGFVSAVISKVLVSTLPVDTWLMFIAQVGVVVILMLGLVYLWARKSGIGYSKGPCVNPFRV